MRLNIFIENRGCERGIWFIDVISCKNPDLNPRVYFKNMLELLLAELLGFKIGTPT